MSLRNSLLAVLAIAALGVGFAVSSAFRALFFRASARIKHFIALAVLLVALALTSAAATAACYRYEQQPPFGLEAGLMLLTRRRLPHSIGAVKARKSSIACWVESKGSPHWILANTALASRGGKNGHSTLAAQLSMLVPTCGGEKPGWHQQWCLLNGDLEAEARGGAQPIPLLSTSELLDKLTGIGNSRRHYSKSCAEPGVLLCFSPPPGTAARSTGDDGADEADWHQHQVRSEGVAMHDRIEIGGYVFVIPPPVVAATAFKTRA